jgi:uncharacterized DUF497 family protein
VKHTWDEVKRRGNLKKHRLDFADAEAVFEGATFTFEDDRFDYREQRYITLGMWQGMVVLIAHAEEGDVTRIISMRKATRYEAELYFEQFGK